MPPPGRTDDLQGLLQLRPAVALQRPEHIAGQAFAVQADERRLAPEGANDQRDMLLSVVGSAEDQDLRWRQPFERQPGTSHDLDPQPGDVRRTISSRAIDAVAAADGAPKGGKEAASRARSSAALAVSAQSELSG